MARNPINPRSVNEGVEMATFSSNFLDGRQLTGKETLGAQADFFRREKHSREVKRESIMQVV